MLVESYIGLVSEIDTEDWTIEFIIPKVFEKVGEKRPKAIPVFHHVNELSIGDEVFIFRNTEVSNKNFYYIPITMYRFVGIKNKFNFIDITTEGVMDIETINKFSHSDLSEDISDHSITVNDTRDEYVNEYVITIPNNRRYYISDTDNPENKEEIGLPRTVEHVNYNKDSGNLIIRIIGKRTVNITGSGNIADEENITGNVLRYVEGSENSSIIGPLTEYVYGEVNQVYKNNHFYSSQALDKNISNHNYINTATGAIILNTSSNDIHLQSNKKLNLVADKIQEVTNELYAVVNKKPYPTFNGEVDLRYLDHSLMPTIAHFVFTNGRVTSIGQTTTEGFGYLNALLAWWKGLVDKLGGLEKLTEESAYKYGEKVAELLGGSGE